MQHTRVSSKDGELGPGELLQYHQGLAAQPRVSPYCMVHLLHSWLPCLAHLLARSTPCLVHLLAWSISLPGSSPGPSSYLVHLPACPSELQWISATLSWSRVVAVRGELDVLHTIWDSLTHTFMPLFCAERAEGAGVAVPCVVGCTVWLTLLCKPPGF